MIEELKVILKAVTDDFKDSLSEAKEATEAFKAGGEGAFTQFNTAVSKAGEVSGNILKGTATAIAGVGTALVSTVALSEEYRTNQMQLAAAFETAGSSADVAKETYNDLYRILGDSDQATEAAQQLASLTTEEQALAEWTEICQGVYATFGQTIPIEGLTEAVQHTAALGEVQGPLADALERGGVNLDDFNTKLAECSTEAEREALIREQLSTLYDDAAAQYEETAASILAQNEAQAALDESLAKIGETMAPVMAQLTELGAEILADLAPYIEDFVNEHGPAISEALSGLGETIGKVMSFIADNWEIITTIGGIILAVAAAVSVLSTGLGIYNTVMGITAVVSAPVIGIVAAIVAGIVALGVAIVAVVKNWDEIKEAAGKAVDAIKEGVGKMVDWVSDKWDDLKEAASKTWDKVKSTASEKWNNIKSTVSEKAENIKTAVSEKWNSMKETMGTVMQAAKDTVQEKLNNIKSAYEENGGGLQGIAAATMEGVKGYFSTGYDFINNLTGGKLGEIVGSFKSKFEEAKNTVSEKFEAIKSSISEKITAAKNTVGSIIDTIKGFFNFKITWPKIPMPKFSISPAGWKIGDLLKGSIPRLSITWNKLGGVFDKPTVFGYGNSLQGIGEDGAEAVVPLEKNTEWMDKIADRLAAKMGNHAHAIYVDGKAFGEAALETLNGVTRQRGRCDLLLG